MAQNNRDVQSPLLAAIAQELRLEVARQRTTLREVARKSGVPYATVQKSLAGTRMIDVTELAKLCYALDLTPSTLFAKAESRPASTVERRSG